MSFDVGFEFRSTAGYVSDGAGDTHVVTSSGNTPVEAYATTRTVNGVSVTFGWEDVPLGGLRDRSNTVDSRLAGINFVTAAGKRFRVDLPATGSYTIHLAVGDPLSSGSPGHWDVYDGTTLLFGVTGAGSGFTDANGNTYNAATWPGSETGNTQTFAGTVLRLQSHDASSNCVAYLRVVQASSPPPPPAGPNLIPLLGVG